jgi:FkbM family methyltransferase
VFNHYKQCRYGFMVYHRYDVYVGRSLDLYGEFSHGEVELFERLLRAGDVVAEVGANIGAHTLRLAQLVGARGRVYAFEPLRVVFQTLCANMALNSITNVFCYQQGVGNHSGELLTPAVNYERIGNFGGIELGEDAAWRAGGPAVLTEAVPLVTLDHALAGVGRLRLLKIDVEGMELEVLQGARDLIRRARPVLYVENDRPDKAEALVADLRGLGYALYWHTPLLYNPRNFFGNAEDIFPGVMSINILAVPPDAGVVVQGLEPVESPIHRLLVR